MDVSLRNAYEMTQKKSNQDEKSILNSKVINEWTGVYEKSSIITFVY